MTPKIKTNWQLYSPNLDMEFPKMKSWVEENESLMRRLRKREKEISLEVLEEGICIHTDKELNLDNIEGNLRKIYLRSKKNIVFAESFFSNEVIEKIPKFGQLNQEPLGKFLFNDPNIEKRDTYVAIYMQGDKDFIGRKCIYAYQEALFSVIEVFLFHE